MYVYFFRVYMTGHLKNKIKKIKIKNKISIMLVEKEHVS